MSKEVEIFSALTPKHRKWLEALLYDEDIMNIWLDDNETIVTMKVLKRGSYSKHEKSVLNKISEYYKMKLVYDGYKQFKIKGYRI